jgi:lipopolysaccharide export system permease protein
VRLFTRHIFFELITVFLVVLTMMTMPLMIVLISQEALSQGLGVGQIVLLLPYVLPMALRFAVPGTILFAACTVYGRMSASNEVVALKSLGISPMAVLWPSYLVAFLLSLGSVWVNDLAVSWGRLGVQSVIVSSFEEIAYGMLRKNKAYSTKKFEIVVKDVVGRRLVQPIITLKPTDDSPQKITFIAREAEFKADTAEGTLTIILEDTSAELNDKPFLINPGSYRHTIPLSDGSRRPDASVSPSNLALWQLPAERTQQEEQIVQFDQQLAADATYQLLTGEFPALAGPAWQKNEEIHRGFNARWHRLKTEPHRRWANGFSCLCFVAIGAPTAVWLRRSDVLGSFFVCFLPILGIYYPLLIFGVDQAKGGSMPPHAVWLGNVILLLSGYWITRKVLRY